MSSKYTREEKEWKKNKTVQINSWVWQLGLKNVSKGSKRQSLLGRCLTTVTAQGITQEVKNKRLRFGDMLLSLQNSSSSYSLYLWIYYIYFISFFFLKKRDLIKPTQKGQVEASSQMLTPYLVFEDLQAQEIGGLVCYC